jgi:hypothetical protein
MPTLFLVLNLLVLTFQIRVGVGQVHTFNGQEGAALAKNNARMELCKLLRYFQENITHNE